MQKLSMDIENSNARRSSVWAQDLKLSSPRRMRLKVEGKDHLAPRFRRVTPHPAAPAFNFSFACGGWLQFYMFGVAKCLTDHGFHAVSEDQKFIGSSAGALTALGMGLDGCWDTAISYCKEVLIPKCWGSWGGPFRLTRYVRDCAIRTLDLELAMQLKKEVTAVITRVTPVPRSERIDTFESREHVVDVLLASTAAIPLASPIFVNNGWCIDGGISDFQPKIQNSDIETIYVNPFYLSDADIRPSRYVPVWWAFLPPSNVETVDWIYDLGYRDGLAWMERRGLSSVCTHRKDCRDCGDEIFMDATLKENVSIHPSSILQCSLRPPKSPHPYDMSNLRNRRFQRLVGYGAGQLLIERIFDKILGFWLAVLWQPAALILIVSEVLVRIVFKVILACVKEVAPAFPATVLVSCLVVPSSSAFLIILPLLLVLACTFRALADGTVAAEDWAQLKDYGRALTYVLIRRARDLETGIRLESCTAVDIVASHSIIYRCLIHILH